MAYLGRAAHDRVARIADAAQAAGGELVAGRAAYMRAGMLADDHLAEEQTDAFADCVARFRRLGARRELVYSLASLQTIRSVLRQPTEAAGIEALELARVLDEPACLLLALRARGESLLFQDRPVEALPVLGRALELCGTLGDLATRRMVLYLMAKCALALRDPDQARTHVTQAMELVDERTNPRAEAWLLIERGRIAMAAGDAPAAMADARHARRIHRRIHDRRGLLGATLVLAEGYRRTDRPGTAAGLVRRYELLLEASDGHTRALAQEILDQAS